MCDSPSHAHSPYHPPRFEHEADDDAPFSPAHAALANVSCLLGFRPLRAAVVSGHAEVVHCLLKHQHAASFSGRMHDALSEAIRVAAQSGHRSVLQLLLDDGRGDPAAHWNCSICSAAGAGHLDAVDLLMSDRRVDPAFPNNCALRMAAEHGHLAVVDRLLRDPRVDASADDSWALCVAAGAGHASVVDRLLADPRVHPAGHRQYALRMAAAGGHLNVVERLLSDPRITADADGNAAVKEAADRGHLAVARCLLEYDAVLAGVQSSATTAVRVLSAFGRALACHGAPARLMHAAWRCYSASQHEAQNCVLLSVLARPSAVHCMSSAAWLRRRAVVLARAAAFEG